MINRDMFQKKIKEKLNNDSFKSDTLQDCADYIYVAEMFYDFFLDNDKIPTNKVRKMSITSMVRLFVIFEECVREEEAKKKNVTSLNLKVMDKKEKKGFIKAEKKSNKRTFLNDLKLVKNSYARGRVEKDMVEKLIKRIERKK